MKQPKRTPSPPVAHRPRTYGTADIALILGIPEWRVKNFSQGAVYKKCGLTPTIGGQGKGVRRRYTFDGLIRMAIAYELIAGGLSSESAASALEQLTDPALRRVMADFQPAREQSEPTMLVQTRKAWFIYTVEPAKKEWSDFVQGVSGALSIFALNLDEVLYWVSQSLTELEGEGKV